MAFLGQLRGGFFCTARICMRGPDVKAIQIVPWCHDQKQLVDTSDFMTERNKCSSKTLQPFLPKSRSETLSCN